MASLVAGESAAHAAAIGDVNDGVTLVALLDHAQAVASQQGSEALSVER